MMSNASAISTKSGGGQGRIPTSSITCSRIACRIHCRSCHTADPCPSSACARTTFPQLAHSTYRIVLLIRLPPSMRFRAGLVLCQAIRLARRTFPCSAIGSSLVRLAARSGTRVAVVRGNTVFSPRPLSRHSWVVLRGHACKLPANRIGIRLDMFVWLPVLRCSFRVLALIRYFGRHETAVAEQGTAVVGRLFVCADLSLHGTVCGHVMLYQKSARNLSPSDSICSHQSMISLSVLSFSVTLVAIRTRPIRYRASDSTSRFPTTGCRTAGLAEPAGSSP